MDAVAHPLETEGAAFPPQEVRRLADAVRNLGWQAGVTHFLATTVDELQWTRFRALFMEQAGWRFLLPAGPWSKVLLVESRLGSIAAELAGMCEELHVVHFEADSAAITEARLVDVSTSRIRHWVVDPDRPELPMQDRHFDVCLVPLRDQVGIAGTGEGTTDSRARFAREILRVLRPDGFVYAGFRSQSLLEALARLLRGNSPGGAGQAGGGWVRLGELRRQLRALGWTKPKIYPMTFVSGQPHEVVVGPGAVYSSAPFSMRGRLRRAMLRRPWASWFAPGLGVVASAKGERKRFMDILLRAIDAQLGGPGSHSGGSRIEHYQIVSGKVILSVTPPGRERDNCIVVLPLDEEVLRRRQHEARILTALQERALPISSLFPRHLAEGTVDTQHYFVQTMLPGAPIDEHCPRLLELSELAVERLIEFQQHTTRDVEVTESVFQEQVQRPLDAAARILGPESEAFLQVIATASRAFWSGKTLRTVWTHGDFKAENVLTDRSMRRITGIIDWDLSLRSGLPCLDVLYLIAYNRRTSGPAPYPSIRLRSILETPFNAFERSLLRRYMGALGIDEAWERPLVASFCLDHMTRRITWRQGLEHWRRESLSILGTLATWASGTRETARRASS